MIDDEESMTLQGGALIGWRREESEHGIVLRVQLAPSVDAVRADRLEAIDITLNDRQLRSLTRDLMRAAHGRGLDLFSSGRLARLIGRRRPPP